MKKDSTGLQFTLHDKTYSDINFHNCQEINVKLNCKTINIGLLSQNV